MADAAVIRGPVGDWDALRANPDYKADWRTHGGAPEGVETAGFALRTQTEADLKAARWGLLAWEDPRERSKFSPFWIDDKMLQGVVVEATKSAPPVTTLMRATGDARLRAAPSGRRPGPEVETLAAGGAGPVGRR